MDGNASNSNPFGCSLFCGVQHGKATCGQRRRGTAGRGRHQGGDSCPGAETRIHESCTYIHTRLRICSAGQSARLTGWYRQQTRVTHRNSPEEILLTENDFSLECCFCFLRLCECLSVFLDAPQQWLKTSQGESVEKAPETFRFCWR